ncbi:MAG: radical SAM/SPASM domain-containing protein, partial [Prevotellaceae bacterium]|nr:radical SAM/SPASM domain-containing protein [Prevotellaceae bacterium]
LTGGECFTLGKDLEQIIEYGAKKELVVRIVTNGYWAKSFKKAYLKLEKLKKLGLKEFNLSTGDAHQKFVPFDNIVYAIVAALKLELTTVVNVETNEIAKFSAETLKEDIRLKEYLENKKLIILNGIWMPFKKSTEEELNTAISDKPIPKINAKKRCKSLFNTIAISPKHYINACCGLTSEYTNYLKLGNAKKHSLKYLYEYQFQDFLKIWLFTDGPQKILDFIFTTDPSKKIDTRGWHICKICAEIFKDKEKIKIIQKNYHKIFSSVMFNYSFKQKY